MLKRVLTVATLVFTLAIPLTGLTNLYAQSSAKPALNEKKQCQVLTTEPGRSLEEIKASSTFDQAGRLSTTSVPSPDGKAAPIKYRFEYGAQGLLSSISGSDGLVARFEYSAGGKLERTSFLLGGNHEYVVDARGKVTRKARDVSRVTAPLLLLNQDYKLNLVKAAYADPCTVAMGAEAVALGGVVLCCGTGYCDCEAAQQIYSAAKTLRKAACGNAFAIEEGPQVE